MVRERKGRDKNPITRPMPSPQTLDWKTTYSYATTATLVFGKLEHIHGMWKMVNPIGKRLVSTFSILQILQLHCNGEPSSASTSRVVVLAPDKIFLVLFWKKIVPQKPKQQLFTRDKYCHQAVMAPHCNVQFNWTWVSSKCLAECSLQFLFQCEEKQILFTSCNS